MDNAELTLLIFSLIIGSAYSILIISFTLSWSRLNRVNINQSPTTQISIIVAVRNEAEHIEGLLQQLLAQNYPKGLYEIIIVNDHSSDNTSDILSKFHDHRNMKVLDLEQRQSGKKSAIDTGVRNAAGCLICTIDADCLPGPEWLNTISSCYEDGGYKMIAGPVAIYRPRGWLASFQALELLSLVSSGAGAIGIKKPIMCNGANLSYEKEAFLEVSGFKGNEHIPGGDDMFMMEKINKHYPKGSIGFSNNPEGIVFTKASKTLKAFMNQRFRWVAKSPAYRNPFLITSAIIVLFFNLNLLAALVFAFISLPGLLIFGGLFFLKCIIDFPILWKASKFAGQSRLIGNYISFQFIYFIFISLSGTLGNILSYSWKERKK